MSAYPVAHMSPTELPIGLPTRHSPTAEPPESLHFQGVTRAGVLTLTLPRDAGTPDRVTGPEQVLCLAQAEPLIQAVEQWLRLAWDPSPVATPDTAVRCRAVVRDPALAPPGTVLGVPAGALRVLPPDALRAPALAWNSQPARVLLSTVPPAALDRLQPGGLLWLPASLGAGWPVRLIDPAHCLPPRAAQLDLATQRLTVMPHGETDAWVASDDEDAAVPRVLLGCEVGLPLDHWLGWTRADAVFHWPLPQPWQAELLAGDSVLARGSLLPMGAGCGLLIESLAAAATAATPGA